MKAKFLLSSLSLLLVTGFVFGMDIQEKKPSKPVAKKSVELSKPVQKKVDHHLLFILNDKKEIVEYGSRNMEFACPAKDFMGKKITDAVPLSDADQKALRRGLRGAKASSGKTEKLVPYTLNEIRFCAAIKHRTNQYRVVVRQNETIQLGAKS